MPYTDFIAVVQWWLGLFVIGAASFPLTKVLFTNHNDHDASSPSWYDYGYFFSKAVGMALVSYLVFLGGSTKLFPFTFASILGVVAFVFLCGVFVLAVNRRATTPQKTIPIRTLVIIFLEEAGFFLALLLWAFVKAHEPNIRGLEKFMDYGFMQSILNSHYFPVRDMWWANGWINYYFFGHLTTAVITRLTGLDLSITYNLMLSTLFALCSTMSFSIGVQLLRFRMGVEKRVVRLVRLLFGGILTSFLVTMAGNMQTLYAFTKGYTGDNVVPFWTILWSPAEFFTKVGEGMKIYWYANATRFIPFTIHEFPSYSFVVSDVHGHVLGIPFSLLTIALFVMIFVTMQGEKKGKHSLLRALKSPMTIRFVFAGFITGVLLMTNALAGPLYGGLFVALIGVFIGLPLFVWRSKISTVLKHTSIGTFPGSVYDYLKAIMIPIDIVGISAFLTALPFLRHFDSFASGIGVNCPPSFLSNTIIGPFVFEGVEKCQKSPLWMMTLLWGFFWFTGFWLFVKNMWHKGEQNSAFMRILKVFFLYSLVLIIIPEFFYVKDIYPAHFRSNTMFKLGYEAFMMWSIIAGFVIVSMLFSRFQKGVNRFRFALGKNIVSGIVQNGKRKLQILFIMFLVPQLFLVSIYPNFSVRSYFGDLKNYKGLYGLKWMEEEYPGYFATMKWLKHTVATKNNTFNRTDIIPVIVEADGDSYTDYNQISAFSGVPTIIGWAVHEWLWRGSYDVVSPRKDDVRTVYESGDTDKIQEVLNRYHVSYILIGPLERKKYVDIEEDVIASLCSVAFQSNDVTLYEVSGEGGRQ